jgi:hypothetical protein
MPGVPIPGPVYGDWITFYFHFVKRVIKRFPKGIRDAIKARLQP